MYQKNDEYANDNEKLHNFYVGATMSGLQPETVLWFFMLKHYISLRDIVYEIERSGTLPDDAMVQEKITDMINYSILLKSLIIDRKGDHDDTETNPSPIRSTIRVGDIGVEEDDPRIPFRLSGSPEDAGSTNAAKV
jgi:hypothetical protein